MANKQYRATATKKIFLDTDLKQEAGRKITGNALQGQTVFKPDEKLILTKEQVEYLKQTFSIKGIEQL